jgi:L,D-transpeptidase YcbB
MPLTNRSVARHVWGLVAIAASAIAFPASAQEKPAASPETVIIQLPETAAPVTTDDGKGLATIIALPEAPPAAVVIAPAELAGLSPPGTPEPVKPEAVVSAPETRVEIALPETAPAEVTLSARDLESAAPPAPATPETTAAITIPEIAPAEMVMAPADLAGLAPPKPEARPEPVPEAKQAEIRTIGPVPADAVKAAVLRLKAGSRITDVEAQEALAFYEARQFAPLWIENGQWNEKARTIRARLAAAAEEGLDAARYRSVAAFHAGSEPHWPALAAAEAQLTESIILYAREASTGRTKPGQIHPLLTPRLQHASAKAVLTAVSDAADASLALQSYNPPHPEYAALRNALENARNSRPAVASGEPIPEGPPLRIGMRDPRVPLIRARLGLGYDAAAVYDRNVSIKVASLQRDNGLPVTGAFTPMTRRVLVGEGPSAEESEIMANMEFWRWMPRQLGAEHILVNAPSLGMVVRKDGNVVHEARIVIGKDATQTPFFSDLMDHIVVNPSWYVPPGILKRDPKYLDPAWAAARGYELRTRGSITTVRVPPGSSNALGYVKFIFPNEHAVYLHDTPSRGVFNAQNRALSNGCVRVENPFKLAALLFASEGWTEERFRRLIGGGERQMKLPRKMPVHLAYFTLAVDSEGKLKRYPDVYGHSAKLRQLLGLS